MPNDATTLTDTLNRLRSVEGHIRGVQRMIEDDAYCIDIIQQIQAVQAALSKISIQVLDGHLHHCVTEAIRGENPADRERVLEEIKDVFQARSRITG